jgi:DNA polymerase III subunit chi
MTRIDFYHSVQDKQNFALRLAEKCWQQQSPLFVLLPDSTTLAAFDQALWERRPESFIPHAIWSIDREQPEPAIWLGESVPRVFNAV